MADDPEADVPSGIDFRVAADATTWADQAEGKRPWRTELRRLIAESLHELSAPVHVLELGSGPGWLAQTILETCTIDRYTAFDFSPPFLAMCRERIGADPRVHFVMGDFTRAGWSALIDQPVDAVVAMQAVHEVRHKRHLPKLYAEVATAQRPGGLLVVCDHEPPDASARMTALHATEAEQHAALHAAGFCGVSTRTRMHGMYICSGRRP